MMTLCRLLSIPLCLLLVQLFISFLFRILHDCIFCMFVCMTLRARVCIMTCIYMCACDSRCFNFLRIYMYFFLYIFTFAFALSKMSPYDSNFICVYFLWGKKYEIYYNKRSF